VTKEDSRYVKPFIICGSKNCHQVKLLDPITLEIVRTYEFENYTQGFTACNVLGKVNFEKSIQFTKHIAVSCLDKKVRFFTIDNVGQDFESKSDFKNTQHEVVHMVFKDCKNHIEFPENIMC